MAVRCTSSYKISVLSVEKSPICREIIVNVKLRMRNINTNVLDDIRHYFLKTPMDR